MVGVVVRGPKLSVALLTGAQHGFRHAIGYLLAVGIGCLLGMGIEILLDRAEEAPIPADVAPEGAADEIADSLGLLLSHLDAGQQPPAAEVMLAKISLVRYKPMRMPVVSADPPLADAP